MDHGPAGDFFLIVSTTKPMAMVYGPWTNTKPIQIVTFVTSADDAF